MEQLSRQKKIAILQQIADGHATPDILLPAIEYSVMKMGGPTVEYWVDGQRLGAEQYAQWRANFEANNARRTNKHTIWELHFQPDQSCKKGYACQGLPNCLDGCGCEWVGKN
jgi:hypothetical protein